MSGLFVGLLAVCGQPAGPAPVPLYAHEVKVRPANQPDFKAARWVGVEFFRDPPTGAVVAVTDRGRVAVAPAGDLQPVAKPGWVFAHDLQARGPDEDQFAPTTKAFGVEGYKDPSTGRLLYLTHDGTVALADYPPAVLADKGVKFHHAFVLRVRAAAEDQFTDTSKRVGVEVYQDGNTGGLVYVTDSGFLATAPAPAQLKAGDPARKVAPLYGQALPVRKAAEATVTDRTVRVGLEVYRDAATGYLVYVTEAGGVAVAPTPAAGVKAGQGFRPERGLQLTVRPAGEAKLDKAAKVGVEVVTDNNSGHTLFLADSGAVAVLPKK